VDLTFHGNGLEKAAVRDGYPILLHIVAESVGSPAVRRLNASGGFPGRILPAFPDSSGDAGFRGTLRKLPEGRLAVDGGNSLNAFPRRKSGVIPLRGRLSPHRRSFMLLGEPLYAADVNFFGKLHNNIA
jgi:hypothetical protein